MKDFIFLAPIYCMIDYEDESQGWMVSNFSLKFKNFLELGYIYSNLYLINLWGGRKVTNIRLYI